MKIRLLLAFLMMGSRAAAQDTLATEQLREVTIKAFEQTGSLQQIPAAISHISAELLGRYDNQNILNAVNAQPGVRMEERSPGSYRFNIRGSSMRSPFGVRNVKVYYNDIPLTDAGGTTYLNQLGYYNFASIDILKGPGGSIYGAGTGGVILINSMDDDWKRGARVSFTGGSFGLLQGMAELRIGTDSFRNTIRYQQLRSDGYRQHTDTRKDVLSWDATARLNAATRLQAHFLYSDLQYQTPGALTSREWDSASRMARPGTAQAPGAIDNKAAIYQKTFLAGFSAEHKLDRHWQQTTTLFGLYAQLYNPTIRNYSKTSEPNVGARTVLRYQAPFYNGLFQWITGGEWQQNFTTVQTYSNRNGNPDTLQSDDITRSRVLLAFTQASFQVKGWLLTAGVSYNNIRFLFARVSTPPYQETVRDFDREWSPRFSVLKTWDPALTTYATVSRGFSPPVSTELSPSGGILNPYLHPEQGWNYEIGLRGRLLQDRLHYDLNAYYFLMANTIVQRRDAAGGDYYINSGRTAQQGIEAAIEYLLFRKAENGFGDLKLYGSYSFQHYRYREFVQLETDYSGKALPGVAPHTIAAGIHATTRYGLSLNLHYYYSDAFPLNDANTAINNAWHLLGYKLGYDFKLKQTACSIFTGGDNLLDARYSAGADLNAFGGRYYNVSPGRNFYAGISVTQPW
jgi:iron complex outermembrane receptor protein